MLLEKMRERDEEAGEEKRGAEGTAGKNERSADLSVDSARHRRGRDCGRAPSGASVLLESEMSEMLRGSSGV